MFINLLIFLIILSILVLVHELGHFLVAKKVGIKVEEFGLGFPPKIWSKKVGETIYSLNALPIGGFVKLYGEDGVAEQESERVKEREKTYFSKSKKARLAVCVAGVTMNFLLAIIIFSVVYTKMGIPVKTDQVKIVGISQDSPAQLAGLKENDILISVNNEKISDSKRFIELAGQQSGKEMFLEIFREGGNLSLSITPRLNPPADQGPLGVIISQTEMKYYPLPEQIIRGIGEGFKEAYGWITIILSSLGMVLGQLISNGTVPKDVAGPIGIFQATGMVSQGGILSLAQFLAILSVNLAVMNILPLPALDGGRVLFLVVEAVTRKKVSANFERLVHNGGMIALLFLMLLITINDIARIIETSGLINRFRSLPLF